MREKIEPGPPALAPVLVAASQAALGGCGPGVVGLVDVEDDVLHRNLAVEHVDRVEVGAEVVEGHPEHAVVGRLGLPFEDLKGAFFRI